MRTECDRLFTYGTLMAPDRMATLLGRRPGPARPAHLHGYRRQETHFGYPAIFADTTAAPVAGTLWSGIQPHEWAILDDYEDCRETPPAYFRRLVTVFPAGTTTPVIAYVYVGNPAWFTGALR